MTRDDRAGTPVVVHHRARRALHIREHVLDAGAGAGSAHAQGGDVVGELLANLKRS